MSFILIDFLSSIPSTIVTVLSIHLFVGYRWHGYLLGHFLLMETLSFLRFFVVTFPPGVFWVLTMSAILLPATLFCRGKPYQRFLYAGLTEIIMMISDYLAYMAMMVAFPGLVFTPEANPVQALLFGKATCVVIMMLLCLLVLALKPSARYAERAEIARKFFLFPASQVFTIGTLYGYIEWYRASQTLIVFGAASFLFCAAADVGMFLALRELNKKYVVEQENAALQSQLQSQISYYEQICSGMEQTRKLRHDFRNQLQTVYTLMELGNAAEAKTQLDTLNTVVLQNTTMHYTENPIVDAVLQNKAFVCAEKRIPLTIKAELPSQLSVDGVDLCAVFSNLADNAIAACEWVDESERFIDLSAAIRSAYLIVKTKNCVSPDAAERKKKETAEAEAAEHGFGLRILRNIADRYNGKLETTVEDDIFEATVWLSLEASDEQASALEEARTALS